MTPRRPPKDGDNNQKKAIGRPPGKGSTGVTKPAALVIGDDLEYRIARLYIFMGYFVRRGCPVYTIGSLDQATDLDVMALRYIEPIRREMLITECKGGANPPLDRIFWLSGVQQYVKATQAYLVRKGTKWNIKDFAKECGVQVLDFFRVAEIETALKISDSDWPGVSDKAFYKSEQTSWNRCIWSEPRYWELYQTLTSEIRYDDPFVGVNYLLSQLRIITRSWRTAPQEAALRFLLSESITQLAVFLIRIVELSFDLTSNDRQGFIRKSLTYGNLEPRYADRILNSAYNMTRQAVVHYTNKLVDIDRTLFSMPAPPSTEEIVAFVDELVAAYPSNLTFAPICDLMLFESFTKGRDPRGWLKRIFPQSDIVSRVALVRRFIRVLVSIDACPGYVEESIQEAFNGKSHPPSNPTQKVASEMGQSASPISLDLSQPSGQPIEGPPRDTSPSTPGENPSAKYLENNPSGTNEESARKGGGPLFENER